MRLKSLGSSNPAEPKACCTPRKAAASPTLASRGGAVNVDIAGLAHDVQPAIAHANAGSTDNMVRLDEATYLKGTAADDRWASDGEQPVHPVTVKPFYLDAAAVTNAQFADFIADTGHTTEAETFGWSFVFHTHLPVKWAERLRASQAVQGLQWWLAVPGAKWDRPFGERSDLKGREDHPVVHVSWNDAQAYAAWAGKRLPTEAEWEFAARGGREQSVFWWGDRLRPRGHFKCNTWQGDFPTTDSAEDGFAGTCPVDAFDPNPRGLFNMNGNVWEWCADWFSPTHHVDQLLAQGWTPPPNDSGTDQPADPYQALDATDASPLIDPRGPGTGTAKVQKGGSYLCHVSYCNRYRTAARTANTPDSATTNSGFRCARDLD
ncbi:MAG: formylglycine-generating enzyme family protein [Planctomycetota bacterium]